MSSIPSLPSETCISPQTPITSNNESETLPSPRVNPDTNTHVTFPFQTRPNPPTLLGNILTMFYYVSGLFCVFQRFL
ncbi:hypothetical protein BYT27DRAFT_7201632 [Phlegmacium glaucopus]|nr:hypothetical protein BYT27DRAFT_7201632 [Phlegmacium glaucopus]